MAGVRCRWLGDNLMVLMVLECFGGAFLQFFATVLRRSTRFWLIFEDWDSNWSPTADLSSLRRSTRIAREWMSISKARLITRNASQPFESGLNLWGETVCWPLVEVSHHQPLGRLLGHLNPCRDCLLVHGIIPAVPGHVAAVAPKNE